MLKSLGLIVALLGLAACTTTDTRLAEASSIRPSAGTRILLVKPDIELSMLMVTGLEEPKADWSKQGQDNVSEALKADLSTRGLAVKDLDPASAEDPKTIQLLKLHEAVGKSIMALNYGLIQLPTKQGQFEWTLGEGASDLTKAYDADYALFTNGRGNYSSDGRKVAMVAMALLGQAVPPGSQRVFASLVDLKTGKIVWFNMAIAGADSDMRDVDGAKRLTSAVLKDAPL
jgi:hypothetical protein